MLNPGFVAKQPPEKRATANENLANSEDWLCRMADLVAAGEIAFPQGLAASAAEALAKRVRDQRRQRLIRFVAREIARDIRQSNTPTTKDS